MAGLLLPLCPVATGMCDEPACHDGTAEAFCCVEMCLWVGACAKLGELHGCCCPECYRDPPLVSSQWRVSQRAGVTLHCSC